MYHYHLDCTAWYFTLSYYNKSQPRLLPSGSLSCFYPQERKQLQALGLLLRKLPPLHPGQRQARPCFQSLSCISSYNIRNIGGRLALAFSIFFLRLHLYRQQHRWRWQARPCFQHLLLTTSSITAAGWLFLSAFLSHIFTYNGGRLALAFKVSFPYLHLQQWQARLYFQGLACISSYSSSSGSGRAS